MQYHRIPSLTVDILETIPVRCHMLSAHCIGIRYKNKHALVSCNSHGWWISTSEGERYEALEEHQVVSILAAEVAYCPKANGEGCYEEWVKHKRRQLTQAAVSPTL